MRLHTDLNSVTVGDCLRLAKAKSKVTQDIQFMQFEGHKSNTHPYAYDVQLGTYDRDSLPAGTVDQHGKNMNVRRYKNSGYMGADSELHGDGARWSATYFEWGYFMLEVFKLDPNARWGGSAKNPIYRNESDFHEKTGHKFL